MTLINQPWSRVRNPVPLPGDLGSAGPLLALDPEQFAELIRSHLTPRDEQPGERVGWTRLWALLAGDEQLSERTFDVLEDFLDTTEEDLASGALDDAQTSRARKFQGRCGEAWKRLQRVDDDRPLAWAGKAADGFNPPSRKVIARLVGAIARHRSVITRSRRPITPEDQHLWAVLEAVQLDPRDYHHRDRSP